MINFEIKLKTGCFVQANDSSCRFKSKRKILTFSINKIKILKSYSNNGIEASIDDGRDDLKTKSYN